jgi:hypothetical protein
VNISDVVIGPSPRAPALASRIMRSTAGTRDVQPLVARCPLQDDRVATRGSTLYTCLWCVCHVHFAARGPPVKPAGCKPRGARRQRVRQCNQQVLDLCGGSLVEWADPSDEREGGKGLQEITRYRVSVNVMGRQRGQCKGWRGALGSTTSSAQHRPTWRVRHGLIARRRGI